MAKRKIEKITTLALVDKPEKIKSIYVRRRKPKKGLEKIRKIEISTISKAVQNPIIAPSDNWWESYQVFNPAAIMLDGKVHIIYRSIGEDGISRFGYAYSEDGLNVDGRLSYPVYHHLIKDTGQYIYYFPSGGSWGGCEDPRLVQVEGEDTIYMTYTACDKGLRVALTSIKSEDLIKSKWKWKKPVLISPDGEVHKNWVIFPEKINGKYAILHSVSPEISIEYRDTLEFEDDEVIKSFYKNDDSRKNCWDSWVRGAGPPPIKTKHGWLIFYHGMNKDKPSQYKVGAMLVDLKDPTKILYRSKAPILEPSEEYENSGFKPGVVYASGAIVKDGTLFIYYGGSDNYICVAYCDLEEFLKELMKNGKVRLKRKVARKKS